jgi:tRNA threonylcarbamoyladenosine biosynthesis protein TsaE
MDIPVSSVEGLGEVVAVLNRYIAAGNSVVLLSGDLGAGKTTLVKALCDSYGVNEPVTSPTFSLINEYESPVIGVICHMDLYRIEKTGDLVQIGLEEYLDSGRLCLIEWPEIAEPYYTMPHVRVKINVETKNIRIFNITTDDAVDA